MPLNIHCLNVGHGDCTLIEHPSGRITMIDINNSKSLPDTDIDALAGESALEKAAFRSSSMLAPAGYRSWEEYYLSLLVDPTDYFQGHFPGRSVFRYVQTHPDMDHMTGLCRFFWQEKIGLENMWDTAHTKQLDEDSFDSGPYDYADWLVYDLMRKGALSSDRTHKMLQLNAADTGQYWVEDNIEILAPTADLVDYANHTENWNNLSYIIRVTHAGRSVILPGDAEEPAWDKVESLHDGTMGCDILKAAHHGRNSGYSESAVAAMDPSYVICSVGKKPDTDASRKYADHGASVLSTRKNGTITVVVDDYGGVQITDRKGSQIGQLEARRSWRSA